MVDRCSDQSAWVLALCVCVHVQLYEIVARPQKMGPLPPYPLKVGACFSQSSYINRAFRPLLSRNTVCLPICGTTTSASPEHSVIPDAVMNLCACSFALIEYSCFVESEDGLVKPWLATLSTSHDLPEKYPGSATPLH